MASSRMPDEFFELVSHHLPPEPVVGPKGGRPPVPHRTVLKVIWYVLASGCRWEDVLPEMGCSGRTAHRRLQAWERRGGWNHLHADLLRPLRRTKRLDRSVALTATPADGSWLGWGLILSSLGAKRHTGAVWERYVGL